MLNKEIEERLARIERYAQNEDWERYHIYEDKLIYDFLLYVATQDQGNYAVFFKARRLMSKLCEIAATNDTVKWYA